MLIMRLVLEMRGLQETFAHVSEVGGSGFVMLHSTRTSQSVLEGFEESNHSN